MFWSLFCVNVSQSHPQVLSPWLVHAVVCVCMLCCLSTFCVLAWHVCHALWKCTRLKLNNTSSGTKPSSRTHGTLGPRTLWLHLITLGALQAKITHGDLTPLLSQANNKILGVGPQWAASQLTIGVPTTSKALVTRCGHPGKWIVALCCCVSVRIVALCCCVFVRIVALRCCVFVCTDCCSVLLCVCLYGLLLCAVVCLSIGIVALCCCVFVRIAALCCCVFVRIVALSCCVFACTDCCSVLLCVCLYGLAVVCLSVRIVALCCCVFVCTDCCSVLLCVCLYGLAVVCLSVRIVALCCCVFVRIFALCCCVCLCRLLLCAVVCLSVWIVALCCCMFVCMDCCSVLLCVCLYGLLLINMNEWMNKAKTNIHVLGFDARWMRCGSKCIGIGYNLQLVIWCAWRAVLHLLINISDKTKPGKVSRQVHYQYPNLSKHKSGCKGDMLHIIISSWLRTPNYDLSNSLHLHQMSPKNFGRINILVSNCGCAVVLTELARY